MMDCVQYAAALDGRMSREVYGVFGPFRGVVVAKRPARPGVTGRYTRVWLYNGFGLLVLERHDAAGEWHGGLSLVPIQHGGAEFRESMWTTLGPDGEHLADGAPLNSVPAVDVAAGVSILRGMWAMSGHSMRGVE
jgi:hypothetical protein